MAQLERIKAMEQALDSATEAVAVLSEAAEKYRAVQGQLQIRWDLSEDAVYDLLAEHDRLMERLRELTNA